MWILHSLYSYRVILENVDDEPIKLFWKDYHGNEKWVHKYFLTNLSRIENIQHDVCYSSSDLFSRSFLIPFSPIFLLVRENEMGFFPFLLLSYLYFHLKSSPFTVAVFGGVQLGHGLGPRALYTISRGLAPWTNMKIIVVFDLSLGFIPKILNSVLISSL